MDERNVDLGLPLRRDQWDEIGRRAAALREEGGEFARSDDRNRIGVYLRDEEASELWADLTSSPEKYGSDERQIAEYVYNDGRPYAELKAPSTARPPAVLPQEEAAIARDLEQLVRAKWHRLLEESGLHFEQGHVSPEVD